MDSIKRLFYNKSYAVGSLYGMGVFPFWLYVKYFGKPMYRVGRRCGLNKYFSLCLSHILGALFHVAFFINGIDIFTICFFIGSFIVFPTVILARNKF